MGKPTHKHYKLYEIIIGYAEKAKDEHAFDNRKVVAVDARDALAQMDDLQPGEYVSEIRILHTMEGVQLPAQ